MTPRRATTRPEIEGSFGVVASTHWIATAVGMGILERGGNAFDAAVATAFTLQLVEPHLNGPGGDVPLILHDVRRGVPEVVCGQGPAPAGLTIAHCRSLGLDMIPGTGLLAPCVPGTFGSYMMVLREYGTLRPRDVLEAAIGCARHGIPVIPRISAAIAAVEALFREHWPTSAATWLPGNHVPAPGDLLGNPVLADTYERILKEAEGAGANRNAQIAAAERSWSQGFVAEAIDRFCRTEEVMDVSGRRHRGILNGEDMARWRPTIEAPVGCDYGRWRVLKAGPWTQGLVTLQQLALLKGFGLDGLDPAGAEAIHLQVECAKLAFADRDTFYGDPLFVDVPVGTLLSEAYNAGRRTLVGERASMELCPGTIPGFGKALTTGTPVAGAMAQCRGDTVHFDIIDRWGNMATATPSGGWLQSSPVIPELGFCLGTRAQMFVLDHEHPAALMPGKRPRSTLSPTLALRDGEPCLAWGAPGGDLQDQWIPQFFLRHVHGGMGLQEAVEAPAWHSEHFTSSFWPRTMRPGVLVVEGRVPPAALDELRRRGHIVEVAPDWSEGRLTAASRDGTRLRAAASPRGMQGLAAGR